MGTKDLTEEMERRLDPTIGFEDVRRAYAEGRVRGMLDTLRFLYPKGIQNNDAIEELVRLLKSEKEGEE